MIARAGQQPRACSPALRPARVRAQRDCRSAAKTAVGAEQRLDAHRGGEVGGAEQPAQVGAGEHQHPEHAVGAVDERQALLRGQLTGCDARRRRARPRRAAACRRRSRTSPSPISASAQCGERREVAGAAERAVLGHDRGDAGVEQRRRSAAAVPARTPVRPVASVRSRSSISARTTSRSTSGPDAGRVRADQGALQLLAQRRPGCAGWRARRSRWTPRRPARRRRRARRRRARDSPVAASAAAASRTPAPSRATATTSAGVSGAGPTSTTVITGGTACSV